MAKFQEGVYAADGDLNHLLLVDSDGMVINGGWRLKHSKDGRIYVPYKNAIYTTKHPIIYVAFVMKAPKLTNKELKDMGSFRLEYYNVVLSKARRSLSMPLFDSRF